jgi:hypothetical protein
MIEPGAIPDLTLDKLPWVVAAAWMVWKRLEAMSESQRAQGKRIGDLEDRVARLEGKAGSE